MPITLSNYESIENIVEMIDRHTAIIVSMSDGLTHYDVAFSLCYKANRHNNLYQSEIASQERSMVVAVNNISAFCFSCDQEKYPTYVAQKLRLNQSDMQIIKQITQVLNSYIL